jgi:phospholipid/cholesterol/gamma-HCH transport system substrate-binding protein
METRAPYALIGLFVLAAIGAVFGFVYWLNNTGGLGERAVYRVRFENNVAGLLTGAAVLFNGIRVGEVVDLELSPENPREVTAAIAVVKGTPVRADTRAGLEFQGLTGVPVISLLGGDAGAAPLASSKGDPAVLVADPAAGQSMTEAARQALRKLDALLADNSESLHSAIANLNTFTAALARNSDRVDGILTGLEHMTGGGGEAGKSQLVLYDLTAPESFPPPRKAAKGQLVVPEPTALVALDTQRIIVGPGAGQPLDNAQWSDTLPKLLQEKVIESLEKSKYVSAVARPMEGLAADFQLLIDLRRFQVTGAPSAAAAHVEFAAKILGQGGRIVASRTFDVVVPAKDVNVEGATTALDEAFGKAVTDLVTWTGGLI